MKFWIKKLMGKTIFKRLETYFFAALPVSNSASARKRMVLDTIYKIIK